MRRLIPLLTLALLAGCATDDIPAPVLVSAGADPCAAIAAEGLVDPRWPGLLGCANAVNLRLMIADPRDLEAGTQTTRARDDRAIGAAQRHRLGKVPSLGGEISGDTYGASKREAN